MMYYMNCTKLIIFICMFLVLGYSIVLGRTLDKLCKKVLELEAEIYNKEDEETDSYMVAEKLVLKEGDDG